MKKVMDDMITNNNAEMWKKYKITGSPELREQIIVNYSHLVKLIAGRLNIYFGSNVEYDDLVGYGVFGLIDAIDRFDIDKGVKFETYASLRIRGSIIDSIREMDWVPRSLRQKSKELEKVYSELENKLGRSATDVEVAEKMGIKIDEFNKLINEVNISSMISLEEFFEQNYDVESTVSTDEKESCPESHAELVEMKEILSGAIERLPEKEKNVISMYYYEELTLKEISAIMGVSESRISQLHTKALMRMRGKLVRQLPFTS
jgi:RNA polymerase sigma factor FliA